MKNRVASIRKQVLNIATLAVLIGFTFFVIFNNKDGFSLNSLVDFVSDIHFPFLIGAFLCMFMNIGFKGLSIAALSRALGYRRSLPRNYAYASADIYFSAITPSATGGQPASAFYMVKDDIPISHTTAILSVNLFMYTASLIVLALITFILRPSLFFNLESWVVKVCIIIGLLVQLLLLSLYLMIMISEKMVVKLATWLVNFLALLHIVKHKREYLGRINSSVHRFKESASLLGHNKKALAAAFFLNYLYRRTGILRRDVQHPRACRDKGGRAGRLRAAGVLLVRRILRTASGRCRRERSDLHERVLHDHQQPCFARRDNGHHERYQLLSDDDLRGHRHPDPPLPREVQGS